MKKPLIFFCLCVIGTGLLGWQGCGKTPGSLPLPLTGTLFVAAMDTTLIDSVALNMDNLDYGKFPNPFTLRDVVIGSHKLFIYSEAAAGTTKTFDVFQDETTRAFFWLSTTGPFVGNVAPDFSTTDTDGLPVSLEALKGKVILLALFEHT